ncbi:MAG: hypothetical protein V1924_07665 [Candidatus Bathyarchaeota archaeon]
MTIMSSENLREARRDVDAAITAWREVIEERLSDRVEYATLKGSAAKPWETPADYVPVISDLDIHIGTVGGQPLFPQTREGFRYALDTTRVIEERFLELRPDHLHIPRPQVVFMTEDRRDFLPEAPGEVIPLYGETALKPPEPVERLRARDLAELQSLGPLLDRLPEQVIDRIDLEYYRVLRMLCYVVSPSPVRVLSQSHPDPKHLWTLNRTRVIRLLEEYGYHELARSYVDYYAAGWTAFHTGFRDNEAMRHLITQAYTVLDLSYRSTGAPQ